MPSQRSEDWNKWEIWYNWSEDGIELLNQKQYEAFVKAVNNKDDHLFIPSDGRILSTRFIRLRRNPNYVSPEFKEQVRKATEEKEYFSKLPPEEQKKYALKRWGKNSLRYKELYGEE